MTNLNDRNDPDDYVGFLNAQNQSASCKYFDISTFNLLNHGKEFSFKVLNVNIRSYFKNSDELEGFLRNIKYPFDIIFLTETWINASNSELLKISGYKAYNSFRNTKLGGGVTVLIRESYHSCALNNLNIINEDMESVGAELCVNNSKFKLLGIYRPPSGNRINFIDHINHLITENDLINTKSIIAGDFNICTLEDNNYSSSLMNSFQSYHFFPLITLPSRITDHSSTLLDNIWTNMIVEFESGLFTLDITDHFPTFVLFKLNLEKNENSLIDVQFRDFSNQNMTNFKNDILNTNWDFIDDTNVNRVSEEFFNILETLYQRHFPIKCKKMGKKRLYNPWLSKAILTSIKNKFTLFKKYKLGQINHDIYSRYQNVLTTVIRQAKVNHFNILFTKSKNDMAKTWKSINSLIKNRKTKEIKLELNNRKLDNNEIANSFNDHFLSTAQRVLDNLPSNNIDFKNYLNNINISQSLFLTPSNPLEIVSVIKTKLKNKKTNINNISYECVSKCSDVLSVPLSKLFNLSIQNGIYPDILKLAVVTPVYKAGNSNDLNNYRPISSLPIFNKIFEKLLLDRFVKFVNKHSIINETQFGFQKCKSTEDAISFFLNDAYESFSQKKYFGSVFCDLSKAFDCVNHDILLHKLSCYGFRGTVLNLIRSYLTNRKQYTIVNNTKSSVDYIMHGVPQGSILGPFFFILFINDFHKCLQQSKCVLFADDSTIYHSTHSLNDLLRTLEIDLTNVFNYLLANKLSLNLIKTKFMIFTNKQSTNIGNIIVNNIQIEHCNEIKFLGVWLDSKLTFTKHINYVCNKLSKFSGIFAKLKSYIPEVVLKQLYCTLALPHIRYCMTAWGSASNTALQKLAIQQKILIRIINNVPFRTHTSPLFKKLYLLKLDDLFKQNCLTTMYNCLKNNKHEYLLNKILTCQTNMYSMQLRNTLSLRLPFYNLSRCKQSILYNGIKNWNSIPNNIKESTSINVFKKKCTQYFIVNY